MWPKYVVKDDFLKEDHFNIIKNIQFDTKPDEWDIYKHKRYDAIIGSVESVEYLEELDKKVEKRLRDNF